MRGRVVFRSLCLGFAWAAMNVSTSVGAFAAELLTADELRSSGLHELRGAHLTLYTDLAPTDAIQTLPALFDEGCETWSAWVGAPRDAMARWRMIGYLVGKEAPFAQLGRMPRRARRFLHGYTQGDEFWVREQPSDYFRAHLVLHEGTHGAMFAFLGGCGPPWFMEGTAELLATHRQTEQGLEMTWFPSRREDVPHWGRIKIVADLVAGGQPRSLTEVLHTPIDAFLEPEAYAWAWAACAFLHGHPRYAPAFARLFGQLNGSGWQMPPEQVFGDDWAAACEEWWAFINDLDYGYDFSRSAIDLAPPKASGEVGRGEIDAARGWQPAPVRCVAGRRYRVDASGRVVIARTSEPWPSEADGVTIRYWRGEPLGRLLAAVRPESEKSDESWFAPTIVLGASTEFVAPRSGTLYLRLNDSNAELEENQGTLTVTIRPADEN